MLFSIVAAFPVAAQGQPPQAAYPVLGNHTVKYGESLFCIGRAYKISPWAIAQQNMIPWPYTIYPNKVLQIPNVQWYNIPAGPVCQAQFTPPPQPTMTPTPIVTVTPTPVIPPPPLCRYYHVVRCGDTLSSIAWRYGSTVPAIANANKIANVNLIYVGTTLCIP
jgi:LysM repeat protein